VLPRLSLAVLPFKNLGADANEDYLADAVTEDLTTNLSRLPGALVIARTSADFYKGRAADVRSVGREFGVRYVVEGSTRRLGNTLRVNVQLISTETAAHIWAGRSIRISRIRRSARTRLRTGWAPNWAFRWSRRK
jgi:adenylate cyclase